MAKITIEDIDEAKENGIVKIWWWKSGGKPNEQWISNESLWNILTSYFIYKLLTDQEITVSDEVITDNFTRLM
jgi:hypothetical protein